MAQDLEQKQEEQSRNEQNPLKQGREERMQRVWREILENDKLSDEDLEKKYNVLSNSWD